MITYIILVLLVMLILGIIHAIYQDKKEKVNIQKLIVFDFSQKQELNDFYINSLEKASSENYYNEELLALALPTGKAIYSQKRHYSIDNYNYLLIESIKDFQLNLTLELKTLESNNYIYTINNQNNTVNLQDLKEQTIKSFKLINKSQEANYIKKISFTK